MVEIENNTNVVAYR